MFFSLLNHGKSFEQIFPNNGWVEHNPEEIIRTVISCCNEIIENNPNHNICSIGITNQRETVVLWDRKTGKSLYNAIVWQDRRTESLCRDLKEKGYEELIINKTGGNGFVREFIEILIKIKEFDKKDLSELI